MPGLGGTLANRAAHARSDMHAGQWTSGARLHHHQSAEHAHRAAAEGRYYRVNLRQLLRKVHRADELAIRRPCDMTLCCLRAAQQRAQCQSSSCAGTLLTPYM